MNEIAAIYETLDEEIRQSLSFLKDCAGFELAVTRKERGFVAYRFHKEANSIDVCYEPFILSIHIRLGEPMRVSKDYEFESNHAGVRLATTAQPSQFDPTLIARHIADIQQLIRTAASELSFLEPPCS